MPLTKATVLSRVVPTVVESHAAQRLGYLRICDLAPILDDMRPQRLQAERLMHRWSPNDYQVSSAAGCDPVVADARSSRAIDCNHIHDLLKFFWQGQLCDMCDHRGTF